MPRLAHRPAFAVVGLLALALAGCSGYTAATLEAGVSKVDCDPVGHARADADAVRLLGANKFTIGGWNHASTASAGLALPATRYRVSGDYYQPDPTCDGERTLDLVLVKRLVDWYDQHVNGVESTFLGEEVTFGQLTDLTLELRLRPEHTVLPTPQDVAAGLGDVLTSEQLTSLDKGLVNLELTLFGEGQRGDRPYVGASTIIELDPAELGEDWVQVRVPVDELDFYTEVTYDRTPAELDEYADLLVAGLRINPESADGTTARHHLLDDFVPGQIPEIFKEMGIAFSLIEVGRAAPADGS
ncbi:MAG: hypothetical protein GX593_00630 [Actinomycetales bacterium]|nr:hypothetical protein [Actinomycetales bacterium]